MWKKTAKQYLFLHTPSGNYYLRIRLGGKNAHRESLRTTDYKIALIRLKIRLDQLSATRAPRAADAPQTLWDALRMVQAQIEASPKLKRASVGAYADVFRSLNPFRPPPTPRKGQPEIVLIPVPVTPFSKLTGAEMENWWQRTAEKYKPARANYQLLLVQRALKLARESGALTRDVGKNLERLAVPRTRLKLIDRETFAKLVAAVSAQVNGKPAAEWIEFVAYTGTRPNEANEVRWEDIDRAGGVMTVTGGANLTKNRETRAVPITPALESLLDRIQARTGAKTGRVLSIRNPRYSLPTACKDLGIARMRPYDFRHLFASRCNEAGVDIPTIAEILGHKDGGALAMKTYVHVHREHQKAAIAKVKF